MLHKSDGEEDPQTGGGVCLSVPAAAQKITWSTAPAETIS